jgi:formylglycine-generating enzyme required for sulfatase activity
MSRSLPPNPNLEQEKKRAKGLLRAQRRRDSAVCETFRQLARFTGKSNEEILGAKVSLAEAQHALARERGFKNWAALKRHIAGPRGPGDSGAVVYTDWPFGAAEAARRKRETAKAIGLPLCQTVNAGRVSLELVLIPPGEFMMGSPDTEPGRMACEGPLHKVRISRPFYMGITPVTQAQWQALMGTNPSEFRGPDRPVENVSWRACRKFEERLFRSTGMNFRLPTEAEWEYCCRAGTDSAFYFGDDAASDFAWCKENAGGETHDVARKRPNAFGLYDMIGNVWEW